MRHALLLLALTATAHADEATDRKAAEKLEADAKTSKDLTKYVACGNAYLDIYNKYGGTNGDEVLYNAGVCFEDGKAIGAALQAFELLRRMYPKSKIAPKALARTGKMYGDILQFDRAAERLEEYAKKYAGEKDAHAALSDAVFYRRALGDHPKVIENTDYYAKLFFRKKPAEAANAMLSLTSVYEHDRETLIKHLETLLRVHGGKLAGGQHTYVQLRLGDARSAESCPVPLQEGLCVKLERDRGAKRCTKDAVRLVVPKRTALHGDALNIYKHADKQLEQLRDADPLGKHSAAMAKIALADAELEKLLAMPAPKGKVEEWLKNATKTAEDVVKRYEAIITLREPHSAIVASARIGQTVHGISRLLRAVESSKECKKAEELAAPLEHRASLAFGVCVQKAAELGVYDAYSRMCLREAQLLAPAQFPPRDVHPDPSLISIPMVPDKIGEADWRAGRRDAAIKAWEAALAKNAKLFAPRINLAIARYEQLRVMSPTDPARKQLEADIMMHVQNAAALEQHPAPMVVYGAMALADKKKLDLASTLFDLAVRTDEKYAPAHVGLAVVGVRRDRWSAALAQLERAVALDPSSETALLDLALVSLRVGRFDQAASTLATIKTATYDVELARGVAARGLGKHADAKAAYERAVKLDSSRTEAPQNLRSHKP